MRSAPRFRIDSENIKAGRARLTGPEFHHLRDVLRMRPGAELTLIDERGRILCGRIEAFDNTAALIRVGQVVETIARPRLILGVGIIRGPRMDFLIEKAVELGAAEVWPLICSRGVIRDPGVERVVRWRRLAIAASKQSLCDAPAEIRPPAAFVDFIDRAPRAGLAVLCQADGEQIRSVLKRATHEGIVIACGPEGDFDAEEVAAAQRCGFVRASLGRNRLRTETAALAALALAASALEELGQ